MEKVSRFRMPVMIFARKHGTGNGEPVERLFYWLPPLNTLLQFLILGARALSIAGPKRNAFPSIGNGFGFSFFHIDPFQFQKFFFQGQPAGRGKAG